MKKVIYNYFPEFRRASILEIKDYKGYRWFISRDLMGRVLTKIKSKKLYGKPF